MRLIWVLTVWLLRNNWVAISPLVRPWAIRLRISASRWVRPSGGSAGRGAGAVPAASDVPPGEAAAGVAAASKVACTRGSNTVSPAAAACSAWAMSVRSASLVR
jgi:hypothetical protein